MTKRMKMAAKKIEATEENIIKLEQLRFIAYGVEDETLSGDTLYSIGLSMGTMIPYGFYIGETIVAGCYISANEDSLFVEQLFVHPALQNSGLKAGRLLLGFVLNQKEELEKYFQTRFDESSLEPSDKKAREIFEKRGYTKREDIMGKKLV